MVIGVCSKSTQNNIKLHMSKSCRQPTPLICSCCLDISQGTKVVLYKYTFEILATLSIIIMILLPIFTDKSVGRSKTFARIFMFTLTSPGERSPGAETTRPERDLLARNFFQTLWRKRRFISSTTYKRARIFL